MLDATADHQGNANDVRAGTTPPYARYIQATNRDSQQLPTPTPVKTPDPTSSRLDPEAPSYTPTVATNALCPEEDRTITDSSQRRAQPLEPLHSHRSSPPVRHRQPEVLHYRTCQVIGAHRHVWIQPGANECMPDCECGNAAERLSAHVIDVVCRPNHLRAFG
jgi:hypothetical protein